MNARIASLVTLLMVAFASPVSATLIQRFEVEDLARNADSVAIVRVKAARPAWEDGMIRTHVALEVRRTIVGTDASNLTVVVPGGVVNGVSASIGGMAELEIGHEYIVFLEERRAGGMHVVGGFQGALRLTVEPETQMIVAARSAGFDAALIMQDGTVDPTGGAISMYLDEVEARVKAVRR